ncbi:MAG: 1-deoxy-D-xylulose-5-phosphate reductoisomerase [Syntrophaceae bacterium CG2_30_49_12]|nr:MAG: 1-deoxy-D-xylulose-5-phosphate reductoisomerase [Syntrophaceae bacterium CG2_30_49_12]PIP07614.1 MAG: 1-deoxy-D-xylulose-5-phosphate reductoisomerase [Syntrophobacterales bacterium CG23_combo_of_CG06-09_8_20_14_all_48_27]PJA49414.1 MAG: 1-deoxy-D-xylulose-5-phosphate reductoisomerase [Syntrophobacterales bacterium CG_4_9_14_3_um_filter_49_8]PJC77104.1 MAG: 1-deoxy-D-xylulose-5-phosphate reductoisomerase [Syntrophobacterales bacterium CG_4_8_14_3_um_filter_49_14]
MKNVTILGSTGSIGVNALDVIRANPSLFRVIALAAGRNVDLLKDQIEEFRPRVVSVIDEGHARKLKAMLPSSPGTEILSGDEGYREVAAVREANTVLSAMVGAAGLLPTIEAIEAGKDIALANKETMVMAGNIIVEKASEKGIKILPVDSEHGAIFQCLVGHRRKDIRRIILTASGGPFLHLSREELRGVKPAQALKHPNWQMGGKITIDSASLMNKGLEVIEAKWFFDVPIERIQVHIHPQSVVHSLVEYIDGSVIAGLGVPDMKIPIAYALSFPERIDRPEPSLDLVKIGALEFLEPDFERFPSLKLAYDAGKIGGTMPAVLNAANEVVVEAFREEKVKFTDMPEIIERVLSSHQPKLSPSLGEILEADSWARDEATNQVDRLKAEGC